VLSPYVGGRRFEVRLAAQYWAPRRPTAGDVDAGAELQLVSAGVRGCGVFVVKRWSFPLCAGFDAGAVLARGEGTALRVRESATRPWAAFVLAPEVDVALTEHLGLWLAFEGAVSLYRARFHIDGVGPLHDVGAFAPRGLLGLRVGGRVGGTARAPR
jgi:hypothetical protein